MLKSALNALTSIHSRPATLKRLGSPDMYTPCRITPANFFRFLRGPEYTTVKGSEFIIPIDTMTGQFGQLLSFDKIPDDGDFKIKFGTNTTDALPFNVAASEIQDALRDFEPLRNVTVTGSFMLGFRIIFAGYDSMPDMGEVVDSTLTESTEDVESSWSHISAPWIDPIKKGDRILDGTKVLAVDEIMEMYDLGATIMAYRVRAD